MLLFIFDSLGYARDQINESLVGRPWKEVGFQQENPLTDFRGTGRLGLLNLFCFFKENRQKAVQQHAESLDKSHYYFFACGSINITHKLLQNLWRKQLNQNFCQLQTQEEVRDMFQKLYARHFAKFHEHWTQSVEAHNIMSFNTVLKQYFNTEINN
jgi:hypothetical protein